MISIEGPIAVGNTIKLVSTVNPTRTFSLAVTEMQPTTGRRNAVLVWAGLLPSRGVVVS